MKKNRIYIVAVFFLLLLTDCEKQLDLAPLGELSDKIYYRNEEDFASATLSVYNVLWNFTWHAYEGYGKMGGMIMPDDDAKWRDNGSNDEDDFNWNPSNAQFRFLWAELYKGVQRSNIILEAIPLAKEFEDESQKGRFEGEARFLRAYYNFLLAVNFGKPPVLTKAIRQYEDALVGNSADGEIWDVIISDLTIAKDNLPATWPSNDIGRVTSGSAKTLLGKAYLFRAQLFNRPADYANAITQLQEVVSSGTYSLVPNYSDNFNALKENNAESIFEVQYTTGSNDNIWLPNDFGAPQNQDVGSTYSGRLNFYRPSCGPTNVCAPGTGNSQGKIATTRSLMNAIEPNDPRRPSIFFLHGDTYIEGSIPGPGDDTFYDSLWSFTHSTPSKYLLKKQDESGTLGFPPVADINNDRILRYADVLLMLAEAKLLGNGDVAGAADLINDVRERADPTGLILIPRSAGATPDQMFDWLMHERRIELAFEGWRYYDLVRWHKAGLINIKTDIDFGKPFTNTAWDEKHLLKPIPAEDININKKLTQNPGY